jgi:DNA-binding transcriptional LysR family regulator
MEISDLRIFSAVAEHGSITLAAQKLNRVPSNITTRIQKLEQSVDQTLFIRDKNRLRISPAGQDLLIYADKIINLAHEAIYQFQDTQPKGELRLGSMEAVAATYLSDYLAPYHMLYRDVRLNVKTLHTDGLIQQVIDRELDLALVANPKHHPDLTSFPVIKEPMVLMSSLNVKSLKALNQPVHLLAFLQGCYYRKQLINWAEDNNLNYTVTQIQSYHSLLNCISAGMGIGIAPKSLLDQYANKHNINVHALPAKYKNTHTHLVWRTDSIKPSMSAFINAMRQKKPSL